MKHFNEKLKVQSDKKSQKLEVGGNMLAAHNYFSYHFFPISLELRD